MTSAWSRCPQRQRFLLVVEFAFEHAKALVGQHACITPAHEFVALRIDGRPPYSDCGLVLRGAGELTGIREQIEAT